MSLPASQYKNDASKSAFVQNSLVQLSTLPGVSSAEFTSALPYNNRGV